MPVKKSKPKANAKKKVAKKNPKAPSLKKQIIATIIETCTNSNSESFIHEITGSYAMIVKKVTVTTVVDTSSIFCHFEKRPVKEFFATFYVVWGKIDNTVQMFRDFGFPLFNVKTPKQAEERICLYDGETIQE